MSIKVNQNNKIEFAAFDLCQNHENHTKFENLFTK